MMLRYGDSEMGQREQVLEDAILTAARAGMPPDDLAELRRLVLGLYKKTFCQGLTGESPAQKELGSVQVGSMATYFCPDADCSLLSRSATKDKKSELVELVGGQTSVRTTFDSDSVNVIDSDPMNAQKRRCKEVGTDAQESGKEARCWKKRGAAGLYGGELLICGKGQTARHHAKTYEYMDRTVEGGIKKRTTRVRREKHRHGAFA